MITTEQQKDVDIAVARLAAVNAQIAELEQQSGALKTFIRLALGPGTHAAGTARVSIIPRRIFDERLAKKVIPSEVLPLVTVTEQHIDKELAREVLTAETYTECCRLTEPAVRIA